MTTLSNLIFLTFLTLGSDVQADDITYYSFTISFENDTSIPISFQYSSGDSHCWVADQFSLVTLQPTSKQDGSYTTKAKINQALVGTCATKVPHLGMFVVTNPESKNASDYSNICKFDYKIDGPSLSGSCTVKDSSGKKYKMTVSGESSDTKFTVKDD